MFVRPGHWNFLLDRKLKWFFQTEHWNKSRKKYWAIYQLCHTCPGTRQGQGGTNRDKVGTLRDNEGTSRGKQGQAGPGRDKLEHGRFPVPACPLLALLVPDGSFHCSCVSQPCPCLSLLVSSYPCLFPLIQWLLIITHLVFLKHFLCPLGFLHL